MQHPRSALHQELARKEWPGMISNTTVGSGTELPGRPDEKGATPRRVQRLTGRIALGKDSGNDDRPS